MIIIIDWLIGNSVQLLFLLFYDFSLPSIDYYLLPYYIHFLPLSLQYCTRDAKGLEGCWNAGRSGVDAETH